VINTIAEAVAIVDAIGPRAPHDDHTSAAGRMGKPLAAVIDRGPTGRIARAGERP
jgi:hypothetical protein